MGAIEVEDLTVSFGEKFGLDSITFNADSGKVLALLGPNGAGKTTIMNCLVGLIKPFSGSINLLGLNPIKHRKTLASKWAVMPQKDGLPTGLTTRESVELFVKLYGSDENPDELLEIVGLNHLAKQKWRKLSGGEQQRLSLAIALGGGKELLFLDEPTAGLDITSRINLLDKVRQRAENGAAVIITTHIYSDAENIADQVVVLNEGQLIANASVEQLKHKKAEVSFRTKPGLPIGTLAKDLQKWGREISPGQYVLQGKADSKTLTFLTSWLASYGAEVENLKVGTKSLKEVVYDLTQEVKEDEPETEALTNE